MCKEINDVTPCLNYKCPHNLFWEGLKLDMDKIHITEKAFGIRNCCCLIHDPWTPEEIATAWGLTTNGVLQTEGLAWRKVQRKRYSKESNQARLGERMRQEILRFRNSKPPQSIGWLSH